MKTLKQILSLMLVLCLTLSCAACQKGDADDEDPGDWQEQYDLGVRYLSEGNYEEAVLAFEAAIDIDPKQADAYLRLAEAYVALGDTDKAARVLRQGLRRVEDDDGLDALEEMQEKLESGDLSGFPGQSDTPDDPDNPDAPDAPEEPETPEEPKPDPEVLRPVYMGDAGASDMTPNEAAALAQVLRQAIQDARAEYDQYKDNPYMNIAGFSAFAKLLDAGLGRPALFFMGAAYEEYNGEHYLMSPYQVHVWHFPGGTLQEFTDFDMLAFHEGWVLVDGMWPDGSGYDAKALALNGFIDSGTVLSSAHADYFQETSPNYWEYLEVPICQVDGREATEAEYRAWVQQWDGDSPLGYSHGSDISAQCWGAEDAEAVLAALDAWANPGGQTDAPAAPEDDGSPLAYEIVRHDMDVGDVPAEIYFERPVSSGSGPRAQRVNAFLDGIEAEFFSDSAVDSVIEWARDYATEDAKYLCCATPEVTYNDGKLFGVTFYHTMYTGGARPMSGNVSYLLSTATGELAYINDVLEGTDDEIREAIRDALAAEYGNNASSGAVLNYAMEDIHFELLEEGVRVFFSPDTIAAHAVGSPSVILPYPDGWES